MNPKNFNLNIARLIDVYRLDRRVLADFLYDGLNNRMAALNRLIKGNGLLDSFQVAALADMLGTTIDNMYELSNVNCDRHPDGIKVTVREFYYTVRMDTCIVELFKRHERIGITTLVSKAVEFKDLHAFMEEQIELYEKNKELYLVENRYKARKNS